MAIFLRVVAVAILIHLASNSCHIFRCILQIIVFYGKWACRFSCFVVSCRFYSVWCYVYCVICSHANAFLCSQNILPKTSAMSICQNLNSASFRSFFNIFLHFFPHENNMWYLNFDRMQIITYFTYDVCFGGLHKISHAL